MHGLAQLPAFAALPLAFPRRAFSPQPSVTSRWRFGQTHFRQLPSQARRTSSFQETAPTRSQIGSRGIYKQRAEVYRIARTLAGSTTPKYTCRRFTSKTHRNPPRRLVRDSQHGFNRYTFRSYNSPSEASLRRRKEGTSFAYRLSVLAMAKETRQATLGKFFGKPGGSDSASQKPKPRQQSTLAFSSKNNVDPKVEKEESSASDDNGDGRDAEKSDGLDTEMPGRKDDPAAAVKNEHNDSDTELVSKIGKREKSVEADESDGEPVTKRRKRSTGKEKKGSPTKPVSTASKKENSKKEDESEGEVVQDLPDKASKEPKPVVNEELSEDEQEQESEPEQSASEEEEEKKPEVKKKKMEKAQDTLKNGGNDPYPDWKAGDPVPYAALCTTFSLIEMTTKRLVIMAHCSRFLRQVLRLTPGDLLSTVQLMINKLAADYAGIELGIGESLIMKAIGESTGRGLSVIKADQNEIGDLGLVAAKSRSNQPTMFKPKSLTVKGVHDGLLNIAKVQGHGSQDKKIGGIKKLLSAADAATAGKGAKGVDINKDKGGASEAKYIVRFLEGKLRLGLAEKTVLVSLAQAMVAHEVEQKGKKVPSTEQLAKGEAVLKTVYSELPSYEVIIPAMLEHGIFNLQDNCKLQPGVPLKPMLAKPTKSITEVLDRFEGKDFTCEYKYDGERAQIHYIAPGTSVTPTLKPDNKGLCAIFSRNSEDLSKKYPDVLAKLGSWIKEDTKSFVMDCETVAWDLVNKKVLPFQQLMTRKRKDVKTEDIKVQVCIFAFDLLFLNGESTVKKSLRERRALLHESFKPTEGEFAFAEHSNTNDLEQIQTLLDESVKASCEGLMVKMLDTEESGYEPSKRSRNWLKVKKDYLAGIGDSLDLVVLGAYFGRGKRTSVYGAFLLAAYNPTSQEYESICNIGTGFSEAVLEELHTALSPLVIDKPKPFYSHSTVPKDQPDVWFEPRFVWEVKCADLTLSPRYKSAADEIAGTVHGDGSKGISLRFPRYIKARDDKKPEEASTTRAVADMYRKQESVSKDTTSKGGVDDDFEY